MTTSERPSWDSHGGLVGEFQEVVYTEQGGISGRQTGGSCFKARQFSGFGCPRHVTTTPGPLGWLTR